MEIAKMLESTVKDMEIRSNVIHPGSLLIDFHDLVNKRMAISLSILEVILYSSMGVNPSERDYRLPKSYTTMGVGVMKQIINNRSLSAAMAYQDHRLVLTDPLSYVHSNRLDHIFDALLLPNEVLLDKH